MSPPTESAPETGPASLVATSTPGSAGGDNPPPERRRELFRLLLSVVNDPERAYTAYEDIMSAAGENVVAQIGARVDTLGARVDALVARMDALSERMDALAEKMKAQGDAFNARMDALNARMDALEESMKAQWRMLWGVLGLQAALVVAIITVLFRG